MDHPERGKEVLNRFAEQLSDVSSIETPIKMDGRLITIILAPKK